MPVEDRTNRNREIGALVVHENWLGNTGLSALNAFVRAGVTTGSVAEPDYIPSHWRSKTLRIVNRLIRPWTAREFNDELLARARLEHPDLFFAVKGTYVRAATLRAMKQLGTTLCCFFPDTSFLAFGSALQDALHEYDVIFTTKSFGPSDLFERMNIDTGIYLPHAFDPDVHRPQGLSSKAISRYSCDVSFIGGRSPGKEAILEALIRRRPNLNLLIWGNRWEQLPADSPLRPRTTFQPVLGHGYAKAISASKINLGLLQEALPGASSGDQITSRTFHIPATGGLMLHQRTNDLLELYREDQHCVCFDGPDELVQKIDWLLDDSLRRKEIAEQGRQLVLDRHSWDHRVQTILDHLVKQRTGSNLELNAA